ISDGTRRGVAEDRADRAAQPDGGQSVRRTPRDREPARGCQWPDEPLPHPPAHRGARRPASAAGGAGGRRVAESVASELLEAQAGRSLVILNPAAGQDDPDRVRRQIGGAFAVRERSFDIVATTAGGDAERLARRAVRLGYGSIVAAGGDGTLAEVITGVAGSDVPLGIIPLGTANLVAANLGIPGDIERAVDTIVHGRTTPLDVGQLGDGRYFALIAGAGWDAEVMRSATRELKDRLGF